MRGDEGIPDRRSTTRVVKQRKLLRCAESVFAWVEDAWRKLSSLEGE